MSSDLMSLLSTNLEVLKSRIAEQQAAKKEAEASMLVAHNNLQQLMGAIHAYETVHSAVSVKPASVGIEDTLEASA